MEQNQCEMCFYHIYDDEDGEFYCHMAVDEDEMARAAMYKNYKCPYFRFGDEYTVVNKQI